MSKAAAAPASKRKRRQACAPGYTTTAEPTHGTAQHTAAHSEHARQFSTSPGSHPTKKRRQGQAAGQRQQEAAHVDEDAEAVLEADEVEALRAAVVAMQEQETAMLQQAAQAADCAMHNGMHGSSDAPRNHAPSMQQDGKHDAAAGSCHASAGKQRGIAQQGASASAEQPPGISGAAHGGANSHRPVRSKASTDAATHLPAVRRRQVFGGREKHTFVQLGLSQVTHRLWS